MTKQPNFSFTHDPSVTDFAVSKQDYLTAHPEAKFSYIATSALVLDTTSTQHSQPRVLLLQRAASDSLPNKWEPPGGACDDDDESILHAVARELWEEAGLEASWIEGLIGESYFFTLRNGGEVCQFPFAVQVKTDGGVSLAPRLDPKEHQRFVWATEEEVKAGKVDDIDLDFTRERVRRTVLQVFKWFGEKSLGGK
jgi:8-oxo-dGTP pyrophosphatase MutT (NUDIX family)